MPLVEGFTHHSSLVEHVNGALYMLTDIDAPRYRLGGRPVTGDTSLWRDVLPESEDLLESVSVVGSSFGQYTFITPRTGWCAAIWTAPTHAS